MSCCPSKIVNRFATSHGGVSAFNAEASVQGAQRGRVGGPPSIVIPPGNVTNKGNNDLPNSTGFNNRTLPRQVTLARYLPTGTGGVTGAVTAVALIYSPSSRLRLSVVCAFEPDNTTTPDPSFVIQPTWFVTAMSKNPLTGRETPLQRAYPSPTGTATTRNLPDAYELDSAVKLLRVSCALQDTNFSNVYVPNTAAVNLVLYATWEPNVEISDEERDFLYGQCSISAQQPLLINNTAA